MQVAYSLAMGARTVGGAAGPAEATTGAGDYTLETPAPGGARAAGGGARLGASWYGLSRGRAARARAVAARG